MHYMRGDQMSIRFYDDAVCEKIKKWVKNPNMKILGPNETNRLFQLHADQTNDKPLTLPMIAISRNSNIDVMTSKRALSVDGQHVYADENRSLVLNAIPMKISYQLDIYCKYFEEADEYLRNFLFNLINYPKVVINIPYNDTKITHNSMILVDSTVVDGSDIPERLISGQFTRLSISFSIDDAYMFSVPWLDNWSVLESDEIKIV